MLFVVGAALTIVAGLATGGRAGRLGDLRIAWWWLAPLVFVAQMAAVYGPGRDDAALALPLIITSTLLLLALALRNIRQPGALFAALGVAMNLTVMSANGGFMPIAPETLVLSGKVAPSELAEYRVGSRLAGSKDVILPAAETRLEPLADRYWTGLPGRLNVRFSLGDIVLLAGVCTFLYCAMTTPTPQEELDDAHVAPIPAASTGGCG